MVNVKWGAKVHSFDLRRQTKTRKHENTKTKTQPTAFGLGVWRWYKGEKNDRQTMGAFWLFGPFNGAYAEKNRFQGLNCAKSTYFAGYAPFTYVSIRLIVPHHLVDGDGSNPASPL